MDMSLGGQFIQSTDEILFRVFGDDKPYFWSLTKAYFTSSGEKAIVQTLSETYQIILDPNNAQLYLKYSKIPYL